MGEREGTSVLAAWEWETGKVRVPEAAAAAVTVGITA